jgi:hypothetical protein
MIEGLKRHNYENFWEINQQLCDRSIKEFKKYAVRIFTNRFHTYVQPNIDVIKNQEEMKEDDETQFTQASQITLGEILQESFPRLFDSQISESGTELEFIKKKNFTVII